ncbi:FAD-dependent monooxygenase [Micromonospora sp. NPDC006766]|uniref:FAD-dependent oxidoreductase n=1 Tax=Micromonospora sp. NPDC006766 TaxID=3154778 RepID=UPI0033F18222
MSGPLTAVVAGGGIGGLAAATALASDGIAVTVVERAARIDDVGSGLLLYQNGIAAADAISTSLGRRIRAVGYVVRQDDVRLVTDPSGRVIAREPIGAVAEREGLPQVPILRTALQDALMREARAAGAHIRLGTAVVGYRQAPGQVSVRLSSGDTIDADLLVGADGLHSVIRASMLGDGPPRYQGYTSVRGRAIGCELYPQAFVVNGRGTQLFVAPANADTLYWTAKVTAGAGVWPAMGPTAALAALVDRIAQWRPAVVAMVRDTDPADIAVTDIHDRNPVRRWVRGRVALLGDAAHPMVPALGQGANTALEDAVVLADCLRRYPDPDGALRAYEAERVERAARVVLHSRRQGALDQGAGRLRALLRDAGMRWRGRKDAATFDVVGWRPREAATRPGPG